MKDNGLLRAHIEALSKEAIEKHIVTYVRAKLNRDQLTVFAEIIYPELTKEQKRDLAIQIITSTDPNEVKNQLVNEMSSRLQGFNDVKEVLEHIRSALKIANELETRQINDQINMLRGLARANPELKFKLLEVYVKSQDGSIEDHHIEDLAQTITESRIFLENLTGFLRYIGHNFKPEIYSYPITFVILFTLLMIFPNAFVIIEEQNYLQGAIDASLKLSTLAPISIAFLRFPLSERGVFSLNLENRNKKKKAIGESAKKVFRELDKHGEKLQQDDNLMTPEEDASTSEHGGWKPRNLYDEQ